MGDCNGEFWGDSTEEIEGVPLEDSGDCDMAGERVCGVDGNTSAPDDVIHVPRFEGDCCSSLDNFRSVEDTSWSGNDVSTPTDILWIVDSCTCLNFYLDYVDIV